MSYPPDFTGAEYDRLKGRVLQFAELGPFDASDALHAVACAGVACNRDEVATMLEDLTDLGYLRVLVSRTGPYRFELAADAAA
jgi:hypothetical protein